MENLINSIEEEKLKEDRIKVNKFIAERIRNEENKKRIKEQEKLDDLFLMYLDSEECSTMRFEELEILRKYHTYIKENV